MQTKLFEIRDTATMIAVMAIKPSEADIIARGVLNHDGAQALAQRRYLLGLVGWRPSDTAAVLLVRLHDSEANFDAHEWANVRTMRTAHQHIEKNFDTLADGAVIDVRVIKGEASEPAVSGRLGG